LGTAQDETGHTLDGDFNRNQEGSPADDYVWTFRFRMANDDFANAQLLTGATGAVSTNNRSAWMELGEPPHAVHDYWKVGSSFWYRWTTSEPGAWITFDLTAGTAFDSLLSVYSGDELSQLFVVVENDNYGSGTRSRVSFAPVPGTEYSIAVATKTSAPYGWIPSESGSFKLAWYPTPSPGFTGTEFSPPSSIPGMRVTLTGTNFTGATSVLFNGAPASFMNAATHNHDLRITAVVPPESSSGPITIVTPHGNVTSLASFQVLPPPLTVRLNAAREVEIVWPATSLEFVLESSGDLSSESWGAVPEMPVRTGGQSSVMLSVTNGVRFYRLRAK
jgi:hypothetical protein